MVDFFLHSFSKYYPFSACFSRQPTPFSHTCMGRAPRFMAAEHRPVFKTFFLSPVIVDLESAAAPPVPQANLGLPFHHRLPEKLLDAANTIQARISRRCSAGSPGEGGVDRAIKIAVRCASAQDSTPRSIRADPGKYYG